jgi:hypothetical protein
MLGPFGYDQKSPEIRASYDRYDLIFILVARRFSRGGTAIVSVISTKQIPPPARHALIRGPASVLLRGAAGTILATI